jgi:hypothetical protein
MERSEKMDLKTFHPEFGVLVGRKKRSARIIPSTGFELKLELLLGPET